MLIMRKGVIGILIVSILIFGIVGVYAFSFDSLNWIKNIGNEKVISNAEKDINAGITGNVAKNKAGGKNKNKGGGQNGGTGSGNGGGNGCCTNRCGDGTCSWGSVAMCSPSVTCAEDENSCPRDCGPKYVCGNGNCEGLLGEDVNNCYQDCNLQTCYGENCGGTSGIGSGDGQVGCKKNKDCGTGYKCNGGQCVAKNVGGGKKKGTGSGNGGGNNEYAYTSGGGINEKVWSSGGGQGQWLYVQDYSPSGGMVSTQPVEYGSNNGGFWASIF